MGRIGNFFKKCWNGIKKGAKKVIQVLPKIIDTGRKILNNETIRKGANDLADKFGKRDQLDRGINFANDAMNKAENITNKIKQLPSIVNAVKGGT